MCGCAHTCVRQAAVSCTPVGAMPGGEVRVRVHVCLPRGDCSGLQSAVVFI